MADEGQQPDSAVETPAVETPAPAAVDLSKVRDLILQANPGVVTEMVQGDSFDALLASVEPAKAAYQRIAESVRAAAPAATATVTAPAVPGGQPGRQFIINIDELSPGAKITEGLRRRNAK